MSRLFITLAATAAAVAGAAALSTPALAQQTPMGEIIVYGTDPCPRAADDEVVICRHRPEAERYRIPEKYRPDGSRQDKESWAVRSQVLQTVGDTGINSCSAVGPAGFTGCTIQTIKEARQQRREQAEDNKPPQ